MALRGTVRTCALCPDKSPALLIDAPAGNDDIPIWVCGPCALKALDGKVPEAEIRMAYEDPRPL